jgi:hypothetical protein
MGQVIRLHPYFNYPIVGEARRELPPPYRHLRCVDYQLGSEVVCNPQPTGSNVEEKGEVEETFPSAGGRDVGFPERIGRRGGVVTPRCLLSQALCEHLPMFSEQITVKPKKA